MVNSIRTTSKINNPKPTHQALAGLSDDCLSMLKLNQKTDSHFQVEGTQ